MRIRNHCAGGIEHAAPKICRNLTQSKWSAHRFKRETGKEEKGQKETRKLHKKRSLSAARTCIRRSGIGFFANGDFDTGRLHSAQYATCHTIRTYSIQIVESNSTAMSAVTLATAG